MPSSLRVSFIVTSPFAGFTLVGYAVAMLAPAALVPAVILSIGAACVGSVRSRGSDVSTVIRSALVAASAFGYPIFIGGVALPWAAAVVTSALLIAGWVMPPVLQTRVLIAQVLAVALSVSLSASAAQFFFPEAWAWVAIAAVGVLILLCAAARTASRGIITPEICAVALVIGEAFIILRALPMHWVISGTIIAIAFAAVFERNRIPRIVLASLLVSIFCLGLFT